MIISRGIELADVAGRAGKPILTLLMFSHQNTN